MKHNNGFAKVLIVLAVVLVLAAVLGGYYFLNKKENKIGEKINNPGNLEETICTQEVKICPDGTAVGRSGPNCEFSECPAIETTTNTAGQSTESQTSTTSVVKWLVYQNSQYNFEVSYPEDWDFVELGDSVAFEKTGVALKESGNVYAFPIILKAYENPQFLSSEQWLEKNQRESGLVAEGIHQVIIGGAPGITFSDLSVDGRNYLTSYVAKGGLLYELVYDTGIYQLEYEAIFDQIVLSFKFL